VIAVLQAAGAAPDIRQLHLAAGLLLVLYLAALAVLTPRELAFLRGVNAQVRGRFILQDLLIQASVLSVLLPSAFLPSLGLSAFIAIGAGFGGLWLFTIWAGFSRYAYAFRLLVAAQKEAAEQLARRQAQPPSPAPPEKDAI
jgi:hypothetical protein